ncbi:DUF1028 domain-containing protein [Rosistilla oblonga]|uniref:DUF1028 domain-containing protein n=1 Tax=Rosistilla oblonga TaxID=2527990 RepID=UPI003A985177
MRICLLLCCCLIALCSPTVTSAETQSPLENVPPVATYSIVAFDPQTQELGVAVQSKIPAVGAIVPWVKAGVGAIATQSFSNTQYGPDGLSLLAEGKTAAEAIEILTNGDPGRGRRQIGIVDAAGNAATFTGEGCMAWAGGKTGRHYAVQGNILVSEEVVDAIAAGFEQSQGELATRLIDALQAGQAAGGEKRGMQSAALYIAREGWGYAGLNDRYRDIRVDDHADPITELRRVYQLHKQLFPTPQ